MERTGNVLVAFVLVCLLSAGAAGEESRFAPDRIIVKFRPRPVLAVRDGLLRTGYAAVDALNAQHGIGAARQAFACPPTALARDMGLDRVYVLEAGRDIDVLPAVEQYLATGVFEYAEPDYRGHGDATTPNDPSYSLQWGFNNTGQNPGGSHPGTPGCDIEAGNAWDIERGSRDIVIGILDTGIDLNHTEFTGGFTASQLWRNVDEIPGNAVDDDGNGCVDDTIGWNTAANPDNNNVQDDHEHGTHVSGIVGARTNNSTGVAGTCWYPRIMAVKVLDADRFGYYSWWISGIQYAVDNGARIINMSMSGTDTSAALEDAVDYAWNAGVLVVASMGNDNNGVAHYPAAYDNAFAVGATDNDDDRVVPGHNGADWGSCYGSWNDVMAPGNWVYSTLWPQTYSYYGGTSMSAPFATGLAALLLAREPDLTNSGLRTTIENTAEDLGASGFDNYYGHGRINAYQALQQVDFLPEWTPETLLVHGAGGSHEPNMAVSGQNLHVLFSDERNSPNGGLYYMRSTDAGEDFSGATMLSAYSANLYSYEPRAAASGNTVHVVFVDLRGTHYEVYYKRSTDNGQTWSSDFLLSNSGIDSYHPDVAVAGDNVRAVWNEGYRTSTDGGQTWGSINTSIKGTAVAAQGSRVYVVNTENVSGTNRIMLRYFDGSSWFGPTQLSSGGGAGLPDLAADGNYVYVTWGQDTDADMTLEDIYFRRSTSQGTGWDPARRMTEVGAYQEMMEPRIAASAGRVQLVYWGDRDAYFWNEVYHRESEDNGADWGYEHRLCYSATTNDMDEVPTVAATGDTVHVAWARVLVEKQVHYIRRPAFTPVAHDVGVTDIVAPAGLVDTGYAVTPSAAVENSGAVAENFRAVFTIADTASDAVVYRESLDVALGSGQDSALSFPQWSGTSVPGLHTACCTLRLVDDNPGNNARSEQFVVVPGGVNWPFGWHEVASMPLLPASRDVKDGGWLAFDAGEGLVYAGKGNKSSDFYAYEPLTNAWTTLTGMPYTTHPLWSKKPPRKGAKGVTDGEGSIYVTQGNNSLGFWRYDIGTGAWQILDDVPLGASGKKVKGGTDMVYLEVDGTGYVYLLKGYRCECYRYNTASGDWETRADAPTGTRAKWDKGSWLCCEGEGAAVIYAHKAKYHELYRYHVDGDSWSDNIGGVPFIGASGRRKKSKDGGCATWYGGAIYALKGGNTQEFWRYDVGGNSWAELETMPRSGTGGSRKVKAGGDVIGYGGGAFFALKGNKTRELWRYVSATAGAPAAPDRAREGVMAGPGPLGLRAMRIAPNPVTGQSARVCYRLPCGGVGTVTVCDAAGRVVLRRDCPLAAAGAVELPVAGLASGVYVVSLGSNGADYREKLVVRR